MTYSCPHCGKELGDVAVFRGMCPFCHKVFEAKPDEELIEAERGISAAREKVKSKKTFNTIFITVISIAAFFFMMFHPGIIFLYLVIGLIAFVMKKASKQENAKQEVNQAVYDFVDDVRKNGFSPWEIPSQIPLILSEGEEFFFACRVVYCDYKSERTNFGGHSMGVSVPTGIKGMRFRVGGFSGSASKSERVLKELDSGFFIITNQKIGFRGEESTFDMPLKKVSGIKNEGDYLYFYFSGKQTPEIIKCHPSSAVKSIVELSIKQAIK